MKKAVLLVFVLFACLMCVSCITSNYPEISNNSFPADGRYKILGRVTVESSVVDSGYLLLLEEAKRQYPETDDIVNIMVDARKTSFFFLFDSYSYRMTAIAIKYTD